MNRAERRGFGSRVFDIFNHTFLLVLGLSCVIPLIHLLALSFSDRAAATGRVGDAVAGASDVDHV